MAEVMAQASTWSTLAGDVVESIRDVLRSSPEPLTLPRIRAALPACHRQLALEDLAAALERQVAAEVIFLYPKYRSDNDRFWDRPLRVHVVQLLRAALSPGPLSSSELRRRLPDYAKILAESVLQEEILRGRIFPQPPLTPRMGVRYALAPASPQPYLRKELDGIYRRMDELGFLPAQVRQTLLGILQSEDSWTSAPRAATPGYLTMEDTMVEGSGMDQTLIPETMF